MDNDALGGERVVVPWVRCHVRSRYRCMRRNYTVLSATWVKGRRSVKGCFFFVVEAQFELGGSLGGGEILSITRLRQNSVRYRVNRTTPCALTQYAVRKVYF